jgi:hypothetical protein
MIFLVRKIAVKLSLITGFCFAMLDGAILNAGLELLDEVAAQALNSPDIAYHNNEDI